MKILKLILMERLSILIRKDFYVGSEFFIKTINIEKICFLYRFWTIIKVHIL